MPDKVKSGPALPKNIKLKGTTDPTFDPGFTPAYSHGLDLVNPYLQEKINNKKNK